MNVPPLPRDHKYELVLIGAKLTGTLESMLTQNAIERDACGRLRRLVDEWNDALRLWQKEATCNQTTANGLN